MIVITLLYAIYNAQYVHLARSGGQRPSGSRLRLRDPEDEPLGLGRHLRTRPAPREYITL